MIRIPEGWGHLKFWLSGEWQALEERLEDRIAHGHVINPPLNKLFRALELTPFEKCTVCVLGQDPYPEPQYATGVAFSIPSTVSRFPPTLGTIFSELTTDLGIEWPAKGNLEGWCHQGVLLWNSVPTCEAHQSLSHHHWPEWKLLTQEIVSSLSTKGIVYVALGNVSKGYVANLKDKTDTLGKRLRKGYVSKGILTEDKEKASDNTIIELSHPSPRASRVAKHPFLGSRLFSTINDKLVSKGYQSINWRL